MRARLLQRHSRTPERRRVRGREAAALPQGCLCPAAPGRGRTSRRPRRPALAHTTQIRRSLPLAPTRSRFADGAHARADLVHARMSASSGRGRRTPQPSTPRHLHLAAAGSSGPASPEASAQTSVDFDDVAGGISQDLAMDRSSPNHTIERVDRRLTRPRRFSLDIGAFRPGRPIDDQTKRRHDVAAGKLPLAGVAAHPAHQHHFVAVLHASC